VTKLKLKASLPQDIQYKLKLKSSVSASVGIQIEKKRELSDPVI